MSQLGEVFTTKGTLLQKMDPDTYSALQVHANLRKCAVIYVLAMDYCGYLV